jgi:hypothetical protein
MAINAKNIVILSDNKSITASKEPMSQQVAINQEPINAPQPVTNSEPAKVVDNHNVVFVNNTRKKLTKSSAYLLDMLTKDE